MDWLLYLVFNFEVYCFLGWCLEELYSYFVAGHFKKDGFLKGPFKPMYGFAMVSLVYLYYIMKLRGILLGILLILIPTLVEYLSGYGLKKFFGKIYWDYSKLKYNFKGLVCARFSIFWTVLVFIVLIIIQPLLNSIYFNFNNILSRIVPLIWMCMIVDIFFTIKQIAYNKVNLH
ncbi:putative ABC transporter permease [Clostridium sp. SHJSY1]|uniref:putative ABC transporter permease n=1 Tax=Clostridium sp. SHJSY1 TaxID=2942483 RepID=UPI002876BFA2|nr:putative ABC transporter permease [Clostridium sp. SHJSY1]MDS0525375.1 putative ABC transporter permease [Clostridium sp. SHJSY1]